MIRLGLLAVAVALAYAAACELSMARAAQRFGSAVFDHPGTQLPHLPSEGRGGDHLLQVTKNLVAGWYGRPLTDPEARLLRNVVAEVDLEIKLGHAGDRLRMMRSKP